MNLEFNIENGPRRVYVWVYGKQYVYGCMRIFSGKLGLGRGMLFGRWMSSK